MRKNDVSFPEADRIIPTQCRNSHLKLFCLEIVCSCFSDYFDYPYYHSYAMDAYQNLISGDKRYNERKVVVSGGLQLDIDIILQINAKNKYLNSI